MKKSNCDIWIVPTDKEELHHAVNGLRSSKTNTLFRNCLSYIKLGKMIVEVQFDTAFYSEASNRLILLKRDGTITEEQLRKALDEKKISYNEVQFLPLRKRNQKSDKSICFASNERGLRDALMDSKKKEIDTCDYYPDVMGRFEIRYPVDEKEVEAFDYQAIRGVVLLEDKIVILINSSNVRNIRFNQVLKLLERMDIGTNILSGEKKLPEISPLKQYKKKR